MLGYSTNPIKTPKGRNKERKPKMSHNRFRSLNDNEIHMIAKEFWDEEHKLYNRISSKICGEYVLGLSRDQPYLFRHMDSEVYYLEYFSVDMLEVSYETIFSDHRINPTPEFVICLIRCYIVEHPIAFVWRGVSRCAKGDTFNRQRGEALAFLRAIRHSKPVEI